MIAVVCDTAGPPSVLEVRHVPDPKPGAGEVLIRAEAIGVNLSDLFTRLHPSIEPGDVLGYEVAGTVVTVGEDVTGIEAGDRVVALAMETGRAYAELVAAPAAWTFPVPAGVSSQVAVSIPMAFGTAYSALVVHAQVRRGERVLVHSAAGGVGLAAVQIAAVQGAEIVATASPEKHEFLAGCQGVVAVLDRLAADWDEEVRERFGGVDVVLDGNLDDGLSRNLACLAWGGRLISYGNASKLDVAGAVFGSRDQVMVPLSELNGGKGLLTVSSVATPPEVWRQWIATLFEWCIAGTIEPVITAFALSDAAGAHQFLHDRRNIGKVVLVPGGAGVTSP